MEAGVYSTLVTKDPNSYHQIENEIQELVWVQVTLLVALLWVTKSIIEVPYSYAKKDIGGRESYMLYIWTSAHSCSGSLG